MIEACNLLVTPIVKPLMPNQLQSSILCCRPWQQQHPSRVTAAACSSGSSS